jgi:hypothetical protein
MASQQVRLTMALMAVYCTWEFLQASNLTDPELARLQADWQAVDYFAGAERTVEVQRAWCERVIELSRTSPHEFGRVMGLMDGGGAAHSEEWVEMAYVLRPWTYRDEKRMLEKDQMVLEAIRSARTNRAVQAAFDAMASRLRAMPSVRPTNSVMQQLGLNDFQYNVTSLKWYFSEGPLSDTHEALKRFVESEAARQVVIAAIALKRYELRHGKWPATLDALAPEFLTADPFDPMDGKPLRYHPADSGATAYVLYSIGNDGVDNGGDATAHGFLADNIPNWRWTRTHDWVWPRAATGDEIKAYYDMCAAAAPAGK